MTDTAAMVEWPNELMIRDTRIYDDLGGLGQRIYTTAGAGYVKEKYIRAALIESLQAERDELKELLDNAEKVIDSESAERDRYAALLDEIVAFFDVLANKYGTEATGDDEWPTDWIARAKELRGKP